MRCRILSRVNQLRKNLQHLIDKHGTNPTALAAATGVPQPTIHRILTGESKDPRSATVQPLADYFNVTVEFLRTADAETFDLPLSPELEELANAPPLRPFRNVRVVGTVEGGPEGYLEAMPNGDGAIEYPAKHKDAYALRVRGESMRPRIKSGEFIVVEPHIAPSPGDDVVVVCADGRKMVKELMYIRDDEVTLGSINDGFKPISLLLKDIEAMHYVAAIVPRGAFHKAD